MLPGYGKFFRDVLDSENPSAISWAWMREAQMNVLTMPNTGIIAKAIRMKKVFTTIMEENQIRVNDLYAYGLPHLAEWQLPGNVHFKPKGSTALAKQVASVIAEEVTKL
jgi:lysophospholipase L1-like esterase